MNDPQPLINAIVNQLGDADHSRSQRFLDDLRQEGVLPGRRNRLTHRLRRVALFMRGCAGPLIEFLAFFVRGRQPASHWLERMDELAADGVDPAYAAQMVEREMKDEDSNQIFRWYALLLAAGIITVWILLFIRL